MRFLYPRNQIPLTGRVSSRLYHASTPRLASRIHEESNFLDTFIEQNKPAQNTIDHFTSIAWTRKILQDKKYELVPFFPRYLNEQTGENRFFSQTVNTETTIPHLLSLRSKKLGLSNSNDHPKSHEHSTTTPQPEVLCLMSLGQDLEAHPSIVHGGFQGVIFDEIMRFVILLHYNLTCAPGPRARHYTVNMSLSYRAPVDAPSTVLVRSWLKKQEGRKWFIAAEIVNSEGSVLTAAESMWITAKKPLLPPQFQ